MTLITLGALLAPLSGSAQAQICVLTGLKVVAAALKVMSSQNAMACTY
jgi:hypothetical protein